MNEMQKIQTHQPENKVFRAGAAGKSRVCGPH